jgi:hypothetical protein
MRCGAGINGKVSGALAHGVPYVLSPVAAEGIPFGDGVEALAVEPRAIVRAMIDNRSNAFVEAMNGLPHQAKRAARGWPTPTNFIAFACLSISKLKHLPVHPFALALTKLGRRVPHETARSRARA